ncbi:hypothetical protein ACA545_04070 [Vibrio cholerae]
MTLTLGDGSKLETKVVDLGNGQLGFSTLKYPSHHDEDLIIKYNNHVTEA